MGCGCVFPQIIVVLFDPKRNAEINSKNYIHNGLLRLWNVICMNFLTHWYNVLISLWIFHDFMNPQIKLGGPYIFMTISGIPEIFMADNNQYEYPKKSTKCGTFFFVLFGTFRETRSLKFGKKVSVHVKIWKKNSRALPLYLWKNFGICRNFCTPLGKLRQSRR